MMERNEAESVIKDTIEYANSEIKKNQAKNRKTVVGLISVIVCLLLVGSFFIGSHVKEQQQLDARIQRCRTFISFALDKAENEDFSDQSAIKALASNIYAAYQYCDDVKEAELLHDLWNYVLLYSDDSGAKDIVLQELHGALNSYYPPAK